MKSKHNFIAIGILGVALAVVIVVLGGVEWNWWATGAPGSSAPAPATGTPSAAAPSATSSTPLAGPAATPRVVTPHPPSGPVTYQVAQAATLLPGFVQVTINPANAGVGQVQKFMVVTNDPNPVTSVVAKITTDHNVVTVPLQSQGAPSLSLLVPRTVTVGADGVLALVSPPSGNGGAGGSGSTAAASQGGAVIAASQGGARVANAANTNDVEFTGQWTVHDTHTARYSTVFTATDSAGNTNSVTLSWTDPICPFALGAGTGYTSGTATINSNCEMLGGDSAHTFYGATGISAVDGPEHGNLAVSGGTLTIDAGASLVINSSYNISITGSGAIAIQAAGGGYSSGQILLGQDMCGVDNDADHYISGLDWATSTVCSGLYASRANIASGTYYGFNDCNDLNTNVHPGQNSFFTASTTTDLGAGTFDYNCDGTTTYQYSSVISGATANYTICNNPGGSFVGSCTDETSTPEQAGISCGQSYNIAPYLAGGPLYEACNNPVSPGPQSCDQGGGQMSTMGCN